jgi:hypothetical protein
MDRRAIADLIVARMESEAARLAPIFRDPGTNRYAGGIIAMQKGAHLRSDKTGA